jgi:hypothetical protein
LGGSALDPDYVVECGTPDENNRAKCDKKKDYVDVKVDADGKATETCRRHRKFKENKRKSPDKAKARLQKDWENDRANREEKERNRQGELKKAQERKRDLANELKEKQEVRDEKARKKSRMGQCFPVMALIEGANVAASMKREGESAEEVYSYASWWFDEDFVLDSDDFLLNSIWPADIGSDFPTEEVAAEDWVKAWEERVSRADLEHNWLPCNGHRRKHKRCNAKRENPADEAFFNEWHARWNNVTVAQGEESLNLRQLEKRWFSFLVNILSVAARMAVSLLQRAVQHVSRYSRVQGEAATKADRVFRVAPKGQSVAKNGIEGMKHAAQRLARSQSWKKCLKEGKP